MPVNLIQQAERIHNAAIKDGRGVVETLAVLLTAIHRSGITREQECGHGVTVTRACKECGLPGVKFGLIEGGRSKVLRPLVEAQEDEKAKDNGRL